MERFGAFELDRERGELRHQGRRVRLHAQPLRLLCLLIDSHGACVSRDAIRIALWDASTHVDFDHGINTCISQLRLALRDHPDRPRFVETVPRTGYRFIAPVEELGTTTPARAATRPGLGLWRAGLAVGAVLGAIALAWAAATWRVGRGASPRPVLAVLPFTNLSGDTSRDYLGDAMTEELISQLGRLYPRQLLVIARTSAMRYRDADKGIAEIAAELGADYVLEGSVRATPERIRVTAQLIEADDTTHVWAGNYDREFDNPLDFQIDVSERIAQALALNLLPDHLRRIDAARTDPQTYDLYLRGLQTTAEPRTRDEIDAGHSLFTRATERDPTFAPAWIGLARTSTMFPPTPELQRAARTAIERALALDDALPEAHLVLANHLFYTEYDLEGARREFERAIELNPGGAEAHHDAAAYYAVRGDHDRALAEVQQALRLDPLSTMVHADVGWYSYFARRYRDAIVHSDRTLGIDPDSYFAELCAELSLWKLGDVEALARRGLRFVGKVAPDAPEMAVLSGPDPEAAVEALWAFRLRRMEPRLERGDVPPSTSVHVLMALGRHDEAIERLAASFDRRWGWVLPFLPVDPAFDDLRGTRAFDDLVARLASTESILTARGGR